MEESITFEFPEYLEELFQVQAGDIRQYSPLTLAYIGDCIYDLVIKSLVLYKGNKPVHAMHEETSKYVQASAQSQMMRKMQEYLTEEEHAVTGEAEIPVRFRRQRTSPSRIPQSDRIEALLGYLYLKKEWKRLLELVKIGLDSLEEQTLYERK